MKKPQKKIANKPKANNANTSIGDAKETSKSLSNDREISKPKPTKEDLLGHLPYDMAALDSLEPITADNRLKMRGVAARKFKQMQADARAQGIILTPISAFRSV